MKTLNLSEYDVVVWYSGLDQPCVGIVTDLDSAALEVLEVMRRPHRQYWIWRHSGFLRRVHRTDTSQDLESRHAAAHCAAGDVVSDFHAKWQVGEEMRS